MCSFWLEIYSYDCIINYNWDYLFNIESLYITGKINSKSIVKICMF